MEIIGEGAVHIYDAADECLHSPEDDEFWQESFVIYLWDNENKVYVFLRVGQIPNCKGGTASLWANIWTPEVQYKHTDDAIPLDVGKDCTQSSLTVGGGLCRYEYDGGSKWELRDGDISASLTMEDAHPGIGYFPVTAGSLVEETAKNHIEAVGRASGVVSINGKRYSVNGPAWRDHSWGKRNWQGILAHRFYPAMFGEEFNLFCLTFVGADGNLVKFGTVIRYDTVQFVDEFEIIAYVGEDGVSNCGGRVVLNLDDERHILEYEALGKSAISMIHGFPCVDTMCRVTMGDRIGVGVAETSNRAQGGTGTPNIFPSSVGVVESGVFAI